MGPSLLVAVAVAGRPAWVVGRVTRDEVRARLGGASGHTEESKTVPRVVGGVTWSRSLCLEHGQGWCPALS